MSAICRRSWPNMSAISTTGARIDRWDNGRLVHRYHARLIETLKLERSSRYLCSEVFITFISNQYDDGADLILAPYSSLGGRDKGLSATVLRGGRTAPACSGHTDCTGRR